MGSGDVYKRQLFVIATNPIWLELVDEQLKSVEPNHAVKFGFVVYNMMDETATIGLEASSMGNNWDISIMPSSTLIIHAEQNRKITLQLIPSMKVEAETYTVSLTAVSKTNTSNTDTVSVQVQVNPYHSIALKTNMTALSMQPGESISHEIKIYNNGNVDETITVTAEVVHNTHKLTWITVEKKQVTLLLQEHTNVKFTLKIPENADTGQYIIYINASTHYETASAEPIHLDVYQKFETLAAQALSELVIPIILLVVMIFTVFMLMRKR